MLTAVPIELVESRCKGCGLCIDVCARHSLTLDESTVNVLGYHPVRLTDPASCTSCALCARVCPEAAITVYAPERRHEQ